MWMRKVCNDEGGVLLSRDNLTAQQIWSMEMYGLDVPAFRPLTCDQYNAPCMLPAVVGTAINHTI